MRAPPPPVQSLKKTHATTLSQSGSQAGVSPRRLHHHYSSSQIHHSLQAALGARRYACAHLLALRFPSPLDSEYGHTLNHGEERERDDEEEEEYWEDVRSVMGLLISTFVDCKERLLEAIREYWDRVGEGGSSSDDSDVGWDEAEEVKTRKKDAIPIGFAPMPSHLARFATHVDAISTALEDAKACLEECVGALRSESSSSSRPRPNSLFPSTRAEKEQEHEHDEHPALRAYERLRRELGLALRECERGRERLIEVVLPQRHSDEEEDSVDGVPPLMMPNDASATSDESTDDKVEYPVELEDHHQNTNSDLAVGVASEDLDAEDFLPPPHAAIEQVYEGDSSEVGAFNRERSKLTREERIRLAKARRESGGGIGIEIVSAPQKETWGPGGEVVQELKDVIWKVGEERRRKREQAERLLLSVERPGDEGFS